MNPKHVFDNKETPSRVFGKGLHKLVLEGKQAFLDSFARRPDDDPDASPNDKAAVTKAAKRDLCGNGEKLLHGEDYDRILLSKVMIDQHPELKGALDGGAPEVSVFWTRPDGVRVKCRFDYLKPTGFADVKSIANVRGMDFEFACYNAMATYGYIRQATHYLEGFAHVPTFAIEGRVFGKHDPALIAKLKERKASRPAAMAWVFYQSEGAANIFTKSLSAGNPLCGYERDRIEIAIGRYKEWLAKFGTDQVWYLAHPMTELDPADLPNWYGQRP